ncbi:hypothetical protein ACIPWF_00685 [Paenarthrobacter sp. NPDC089989]|uniref:hypothetical protein n=1 Tax=unclassified Paenarthrobacter TaxID=2634190 RepID=UPI003825BF8E
MSREQMKARLEAATPGPWKADSYEVIASPFLLIVADVDLHMTNEQGSKNATFIAHAPADLAKLHAALDAVETQCAATDLETSEALQADLVARIQAAIRDALGNDPG